MKLSFIDKSLNTCVIWSTPNFKSILEPPRSQSLNKHVEQENKGTL